MAIGEIDFDNVEDSEDFSPAPEGDYFVQIVRVQTKTSDKMGEYLWLTLRICEEGDHFNKRFWDKMQFHEENAWGLKRTKLLLSRFGLLEGGTKVNFKDPEKLLLGACAVGKLGIEEYESNKFDEDGEPIMRKKNVVEYQDYERVKPDFKAPSLENVGEFDFANAVDTSDEAAGEAGDAEAGEDGDAGGGNKDDLPFEFE